MTAKERFEIELATGKYEFLQTNPRLGRNLMFLVAGGSYAYGTQREGVDSETGEFLSDLDCRGCSLQLPSDLIGRTNFENYVDNQTDTTIYGFNKFIQLVQDGNPNVLEILGVRPEDRFYVSPVGQEVFDIVDMFLSKHIAVKVNGFATSQLRRIQSATARSGDSKTQGEYMLDACNRAIQQFNERYPTLIEDSDMVLSLANVNGEYKIVCTGNFWEVPLAEMKGAYDDLMHIFKSFHKLTGDNSKPTDEKLNKHAYHLVRLLTMGKEILEEGVIRTYREKEHDILMEMRDGKYMVDGKFAKEFYDYIDHLEAEFELARQRSELPNRPDGKRIDQFVESVNRRVVNGEL